MGLFTLCVRRQDMADSICMCVLCSGITPRIVSKADLDRESSAQINSNSMLQLSLAVC